MKYNFKNLHEASVFNTPYKIKYLGKSERDFEGEKYIFKTHDQYFLVLPDHFKEECIIQFVTEDEVKEKLDTLLNIETIIDKSKSLFYSNIFSIKKDDPPLASFDTFSLEEHDLNLSHSPHQIDYKPKSLDEIIANAVILDIGGSTTDTFIIKHHPGGR